MQYGLALIHVVHILLHKISRKGSYQLIFFILPSKSILEKENQSLAFFFSLLALSSIWNTVEPSSLIVLSGLSTEIPYYPIQSFALPSPSINRYKLRWESSGAISEFDCILYLVVCAVLRNILLPFSTILTFLLYSLGWGRQTFSGKGPEPLLWAWYM